MHTFKNPMMRKVWKKIQIQVIFCNQALHMTKFKRVSFLNGLFKKEIP